jgi:type IV pilus assembly protein PilN
MIRVNLLGVVPRRARRPLLPENQKSAFAGLVILLATGGGVFGWHWQVTAAEKQVNVQIASAEAELARLKSVAVLVDRANARKLDLTERLGLIDRLHRTQRDPVQLLEVVSRSVPDGLWLLELKQQGTAVQIEGRAVSLTALTDFVERLQSSGRFARPVDIVTTSMEVVQEASVVRFAVKASGK